MDNQRRIQIREVVQVTIKNIVIINGKEVEIREMKDWEKFAETVNRRVLSERNYIEEKPA